MPIQIIPTRTMTTLVEEICKLLEDNPGLTDREITDLLTGPSATRQPVNSICRTLTSRGVVIRRHRKDGQTGNYLVSHKSPARPEAHSDAVYQNRLEELTDSDIKRLLEDWLEGSGWQLKISTGHDQETSLEAQKETTSWIIEIRGGAKDLPLRGSYFFEALGELMQRMDSPADRYSLAFPDLTQFRILWERLPELAKARSKIGILFVNPDGEVIQA